MYTFLSLPSEFGGGLKGPRTVTPAELKAHTKEGGGWVVIHGKVYDLSAMGTPPPCGCDKLMEYVGKDATKAFETAGHSDSIRELMEQVLVGEYGEVRMSVLQQFTELVIQQAVIGGGLEVLT